MTSKSESVYVSQPKVRIRSWRSSDPVLTLTLSELREFQREGKTTLAICEAVEAVLGIPTDRQYLQIRQSVFFLNGAEGDEHPLVDNLLIKSLLDAVYLDICPNRGNGAVRKSRGQRDFLPAVTKLRHIPDARVLIGWDLPTGKHPKKWEIEYRLAGTDTDWKKADVEPNRNFYPGSVTQQYRYNILALPSSFP
jgi:hypothetical protein